MSKKIKKYKYIVLLLGITLVLLGSIMKVSYAKTEFTRKELEDMVTSTALSYYYNGKYSDYSQKAMDNATGTYRNSIRYRNFNLTPESINRGNQYFIDCSSFASSVYIHALGYDFSDYYSFSNSKYLASSFNISYSYASPQNYKAAYKTSAVGINTAFFNNLSKRQANKNAGEEYINKDSSSTSPIVYYYETTTTEDIAKKTSVINNIKSILRNGDIIVYRHTGGGHALMYVGDALDGQGTRESIIHSNGGDFKEVYNSVKNGSISNLEKVFDLTNDLLSVMVLRPINRYCISDSCTLTNVEKENSLARNDLKKLRTEAYTTTKKEYQTTSSINKYIGKYNSVNNGDEITYNFELENMSNTYICTGLKSSGAYHDENSCTQSGGTWRKDNGQLIEYIGKEKYNSVSNKENYIGLTIEGTIPTGTTFVKCVSCRIQGNKIIWDSFDKVPKKDINNPQKQVLSYTVKVETDKQKITNEGIKITTTNNNSLTYSNLDVYVNPTLTKENISSFTSSIDKIKNLYNSGKITYVSNSIDNVNTNIDNITSMSLTSSGFIKMLYYNELGIDLTMLTNQNIKEALFRNSGDDYIVQKGLSESTEQIKKMLVPGLYGGLNLRGNENGDRLKYIRTQDLEYGDILVTYSSNSSLMNTYIFLGQTGEEQTSTSDEQGLFLIFGKNGFTEYKNESAHNLIHNAFSSLNSRKDLFLVLRPTRLMGQTVIYNYNNGQKNDSYIAYNTYKNLKTPTKTSTIIYKDNEETLKKDTFTNYFLGWYKEKTFQTRVNNTTQIENKTQNLYANYLGASVTLPDIEKEGYTLEGYYSDKNLTQKVGNKGSTYTLNEDTTLYANYQKKKVTITFDTNGGNTINPLEGEIASPLTKPEDPKKDGYKFAGWYQDKNLTKLYTFEKFPEKDITLYAKWTLEDYTINYNLNGGQNNENNPTTYNKEEIKTLYSPTKKGYKFLGWYTEENFINEIKDTSNQNTNLNLYAKWEIKDITITLEKENETSIDKITGKYLEKIPKLPSPEKEGYKFLGWYDKTLENEFTKEEFPEDDITIYAKWQPINYTIICQIEDNIITKDYNIESEFTIENPEKKGYNFISWENENESLKTLTIKKGTTGNKTYKAVFSPIKYYIIYNPNKGIGTKIKEEFTYDKEQNLKNDLFTRQGYTFIGWNKDENAKTSMFEGYDGDLSILNLTDKDGEEINLYAIWNKEIMDIKINVINGSAEKTSLTLKKNETASITLQSNLGYNNPEVTCTNSQIATIENNVLNLKNLTDDTTCTVKYNTINYKITYDLDGGTLNNGITSYTVEDTITLTEPSKKGYEFIGWTNNSIKTPNKTITIKNETGDKFYKANYQIKSYQINYTSDNYGKITGTTKETKKYKENPSGTTHETFDEYKILKWAADKDVTLKDGTTIKKGAPLTEEQIKNVLVDDDITFTIYHYINKYNIIYTSDENGTITGILEEEVPSGASPLGTTLKPKQGYKFKNWTIDKDVTLKDGTIIKKGAPLTKKQINQIIIKENLTITGQTKLEQYYVNYITDENSIITGITKEQTNITKKLKGTTYTAKQGYKIIGLKANKDVLINNKIIKKGTIINKNNLTKITIKENTNIKIITQKITYIVKYISTENAKITGKTKEKVSYNENPTGTKVKITTNEKALVWVANKDITLKNGNIIEKGNEITNEELKQAVIKENVTFTAIEKVLKAVPIPNTNNNISTLVIIIGAMLIISGSYFMFTKKTKIK